MNIPGTFIAGDTVSWDDDPTVDSEDNPINSSWQLQYFLRGPSVLDVTATQNAEGWSSTITAAQSAALTSGTYAWLARATLDGVAITLGQGLLTVDDNIQTQVAGYDPRSQAEQDLSAVNAEISSRASGGAPIEYTIGNRHLRKETIASLIALRDDLRITVRNQRRAQQVAQNLGDPSVAYARFPGPANPFPGDYPWPQ